MVSSQRDRSDLELLCGEIHFADEHSIAVWGDVLEVGVGSVRCIDHLRRRPTIRCLGKDRQLLVMDDGIEHFGAISRPEHSYLATALEPAFLAVTASRVVQ